MTVSESGPFPESSESDSPQSAARFVRLYSIHQKRIYGYVGTFFRDGADIDEVVQETSVVLWSKFSEFRPEGDFLRWALGVARLEVFRHIRTRVKAAVPFDDDLIELLSAEWYRRCDHWDRRHEALRVCLETLRSPDRSLIEDCYQPGGSIKEVAQRLSRPANAVYQSLSRIRRTLHECITRRLLSCED